MAKQRRLSRRQICKVICQQLRYLRRNLEQIRPVVADGARCEVLAGFWYQRLLVIQEVYRQQWLLAGLTKLPYPALADFFSKP